MNKQGSIKMRNDLQEAVGILSALNEHNALLAPKGIAWADRRIHVSKKSQEVMHRLLPIAIAALRDMLKRQEGCWHCHGIEAHEIEYVTELKNAYLEHIKAPEAIPYRHCANCGRELSGNAEQVKEVER